MNFGTRLVRTGRSAPVEGQTVNPSVVRASTVLFPTMDALRDAQRRRDADERVFSYGARGTPTAFALEDALCELEHGDRAFLYPSGLAALSMTLLTLLKGGDTLAVIDTVYPPVRRFCRRVLEPMGVEVRFVPPETDAIVSTLGSVRPAAILLESPGSGTFEVLDLPKITAFARSLEVTTIVDNTWSAGMFLRPLELGADVSIQALTKYVCGHSDVMLGGVVVRDDLARSFYEFNEDTGLCVSPDDAYAALRGLRSLGARLAQHQASATTIARWLADSGDVQMVRYPALSDCPGHDDWRRDFSGANGLLSFALRDDWVAHTDSFVDSLSLFGIGASWGGYESLALSFEPGSVRTARPWTGPHKWIRLSIGLEDVSDLMDDLEQAFSTLAASHA